MHPKRATSSTFLFQTDTKSSKEGFNHDDDDDDDDFIELMSPLEWLSRSAKWGFNFEPQVGGGCFRLGTTNLNSNWNFSFSYSVKLWCQIRDSSLNSTLVFSTSSSQ